MVELGWQVDLYDSKHFKIIIRLRSMQCKLCSQVGRDRYARCNREIPSGHFQIWEFVMQLMRRYFIQPSWKIHFVFCKDQWLLSWKCIFSHLIFQEGVGWKPKSIHISCTSCSIFTKFLAYGPNYPTKISCKELFDCVTLCVLLSICTY